MPEPRCVGNGGRRNYNILWQVDATLLSEAEFRRSLGAHDFSAVLCACALAGTPFAWRDEIRMARAHSPATRTRAPARQPRANTAKGRCLMDVAMWAGSQVS